MDRKEIGRKIRVLRKELGLTMLELGRRAGLSQSQISRVENGRQGFRSGTLTRLAGALGVPALRLCLPENLAEPPASGRLAEALKAPEFVALAERVAGAYRRCPQQFRAIRSLVEAVLLDPGEADTG